MKALTIHQPWAWLIVRGHKRVENRGRATHYRGPIAIHAGQSTATLRAMLADGSYERLRRRIPDLPAPERALAELVRGAVVGVAEIVDAQPYAGSPALAADSFACGPWCWRLARPEAFADPIPARGSLSFWAWTPPAEAAA